jgi:hypothetical protein
MISIFTRAVSPRKEILTLIGLCLLTSCLVLPGCGAPQAPSPPASRDIPFSLLASQSPRDYKEVPDFMVITNQDDYGLFKQVPQVDFSNSIVLGVGYNLPSPGNGLSLQPITQTGKTVTMEIKVSVVDPAKTVLAIVIYEFDLFLIDRASFDPTGELHFVLLDENGDQTGEVIASV